MYAYVINLFVKVTRYKSILIKPLIHPYYISTALLTAVQVTLMLRKHVSIRGLTSPTATVRIPLNA